MKIRTKYHSDDVFLLGYGMWLVIAIISISSMYSLKFNFIPYTVLRYGSIMVMAFGWLLHVKTMTAREIIVASFSMIVCASLIIFWGSIYCEGLFISILGYRFDFKKIAKVTMWLTSVTLFFVVLSSLVNIIPNYNYRAHNDPRDRFGVGFKYATYPTHYLLLITLLLFYLKRERISIRDYILVSGSNLFLYSYTHSRNSMMLTFFVLGCAFLFQHTKLHLKNNMFNRIVFPSVYICITIFQLICAALYKPQSRLWMKLDDLTSGRMHLNAMAFETYKITPIGQETFFEAKAWENGVFSMVGSQYTGMDSSYLGILYRNGVVSLLLFLTVFTITGVYAIRKQDRYLSVILFVIALHSMFDPQLNHLQYNTFMILAFAVTANKIPKDNIRVYIKRVINGYGKKKQYRKKLYI